MRLRRNKLGFLTFLALMCSHANTRVKAQDSPQLMGDDSLIRLIKDASSTSRSAVSQGRAKISMEYKTRKSRKQKKDTGFSVVHIDGTIQWAGSTILLSYFLDDPDGITTGISQEDSTPAQGTKTQQKNHMLFLNNSIYSYISKYNMVKTKEITAQMSTGLFDVRPNVHGYVYFNTNMAFDSYRPIYEMFEPKNNISEKLIHHYEVSKDDKSVVKLLRKDKDGSQLVAHFDPNYNYNITSLIYDTKNLQAKSRVETFTWHRLKNGTFVLKENLAITHTPGNVDDVNNIYSLNITDVVLQDPTIAPQLSKKSLYNLIPHDAKIRENNKTSYIGPYSPIKDQAKLDPLITQMKSRGFLMNSTKKSR